MKFKHYLNDILGQKSKLRALRYLIVRQKEVSIRELSRHIGITQPNLSVILKELEKAGVLISKKFGTSLVFKLNCGHYLVDDVLLPLFQDENKSIEALSKFLLKKIKFDFVSIILFGSIARGEESHKSDADIAIIIDNSEDKEKIEDAILEINSDLIEKFGNSISPMIIKKKDFTARYKKNEKLIRNIAKDGKLLTGKSISEIL